MTSINTLNYVGQALPTSGVAHNTVAGTTSAEVLVGSAGADIMLSNGGADTLSGGAGDDTYVISNANATIVEAAGGGIDTVKTLVNYVLPDNVENLVVYGFTGLSGTTGIGNGLDNVISGDASNQILDGAGGNDVLTGGGGVDTFVFRAGSGHDVITDFRAGGGGDVASLAGYAFASFHNVQDALTQVGSDVVLKLSPTDDVTFRNTDVADFTATNFTLPAADLSHVKPTFDEEFDSGLNIYNPKTKTGVWSTEFGFGGWGSKASHSITSYTGEQEIFVDSNYAGKGKTALGLNPFNLHDGVLDLTAGLVPDADKEALYGYDYYSGLLTTSQTFGQTYGYFEIRAQMPTGTGTWPAFWLLPVAGGNPPEIDVFEYRGQDNGVVHESAHDKGLAGGYTGGNSFLPGASDGMHTYGVLWDPKHLTYYVDGREVYQTDTPADMNKPMYLVVSEAVGAWAGTPDPTQYGGKATTLSIDYVRAYSLQDATAAVAQTAAAVDAAQVDAAQHQAEADAAQAAADAAAKAAADAAAQAQAQAAAHAAAKAAADAAAQAQAQAQAQAAADAAAKAAADAAAQAQAQAQAQAAADAAAKAAADAAAQAQAQAQAQAAADVAAKAAADAAAQAQAQAQMQAAADAAAKAAAAAQQAADHSPPHGPPVGDTPASSASESADGHASGSDIGPAVTYALPSTMKAYAYAGAGQVFIKGNVLNNQLQGGAHNDTLDGGAGVDTLIGGAGDDTYYVANAADSVLETAGGGDDTVFTTVSWKVTSGSQIEHVVAAGSAAINITGNAQAMSISGNAGINALDDGGAPDTLAGGAGVDTYIVHNAGTVVVEGVGQGYDTVKTTLASYHLTDNVEALSFVGSGPFSGVGNALSNLITGGDGGDTLDGGGGGDRLVGGKGDDTYIVRSSLDVVIEKPGEGHDVELVYASTARAGDNVEALKFVGSGAFVGYSNGTGVSMVGGAGADQLWGGKGADTLDGGGGSDTLSGGGGADVFKLGAPGAGVDRLLDFKSGEDHIFLSAGDYGVSSLADVRFGTAPVQGHASLVYDAKGQLFWDADGQPGHQVLIATLDAHPVLHLSDFILG